MYITGIEPPIEMRIEHTIEHCHICRNVMESGAKRLSMYYEVICTKCIKKLAVFIYDHRTEVLSL